MPRRNRLTDPSAQQMAFTGALLPPNVHKRRLLLLQNIQQLAIGIAEEFIETGIIPAGKIEGKLGHGLEKEWVEIGLILRVFHAQREETAFIG